MPEPAMSLLKFKRIVRKALAEYMQAEGCSCCRNSEEHAAAKAKLAKLLNVKKYEDGSGYDFARYK